MTLKARKVRRACIETVKTIAGLALIPAMFGAISAYDPGGAGQIMRAFIALAF